MSRDYYEILGLSKEATEQEIKRSYRKLAMKYHPDRNSNKSAEDKFKEASEAYEILSNKQKRSAYDQFGHEGVKNNSNGSHANYSNGAFGDVFSDIFGDIFGSNNPDKSHSYHSRGSDLQFDIKISLEDVFRGVNKKITIPKHVGCKKCDASGGSGKIRCSTCNGSGKIRMSQGFFSVEQTCSSCSGSAFKIKNPCFHCRGSGRVEQSKVLSIKIPEGVDNNDRIRLSGEGGAGELGAPSGDLYIVIHVKQHRIFTRSGSNLHCEVPVNFASACLGGELEVPTITGGIKLKIPSETQTGKVFRLRGKGLKSLKSGVVGDLMCKVIVETPVKLNKEQKELLLNFSNSLGKNYKHVPKSKSWFNSVKDFFS